MSEEEKFSEKIAVQNPRKVFINMLILPSMRAITEQLITRPLNALAPMRALIDNLDEFSQNQLNSVYEQLWSYEFRPSTATRKDIETLYRTLVKFLHKHYLREFGIEPLNPKSKHLDSEAVDGRKNRERKRV